ncbi:MAG: hypothetical protein EA425_18315 [Puniceicoccaceae bacterium]|nr:MAG: hypothetical protein EA425_18315 [Puniceicoccaceae bacterium]
MHLRFARPGQPASPGRAIPSLAPKPVNRDGVPEVLSRPGPPRPASWPPRGPERAKEWGAKEALEVRKSPIVQTKDCAPVFSRVPSLPLAALRLSLFRGRICFLGSSLAGRPTCPPLNPSTRTPCDTFMHRYPFSPRNPPSLRSVWPRLLAALLTAVLAASGMAASPNPTVLENANAGANDWRLANVLLDRGTSYGLRSPRVEGFASKTSLYPGEPIDFHISAEPAAVLDVDVYRTGYYGGVGARHMTRIGGLEVGPQPVPDEVGEMRLRECDWPVAASLEIPEDWVSGVYLAKMTRRDDGAQSYIIFVLKSREPADVLFQVSDLTWQSYNKWPGASSLYDNPARRVSPYNEYIAKTNETLVSFDRPYALFGQLQFAADTIGSGEYLLWEFPLAYWLEKQGYHVAYCSNIDLDQDPAVLDRAKVFLSVGHDEFYTYQMVANAYAARGRGLSMAFLSGNSVFDMLYFHDSGVTGEPARAFRRIAPIRSATRQLIGASSYGVGYADWVVENADHWIYEGTGFSDGDVVPNLIGWEFHGKPLAAAPGLVTLASSNIIGGMGDPSERQHAATLYPGPRGNWIFNAGTAWWPEALATPPGHVPAGTFQRRGPDDDERIARVTANFLDRALADSQVDFSAASTTAEFHRLNGPLDADPDPKAMVHIPAGQFTMGSPGEEPGRHPWETQHEVVLTRSFTMGRIEVPWSLWSEVRNWAVKHGYTDLGPGFHGIPIQSDDADHPVVGVSWWDVIKWCNARSEMEGLTPVYYADEAFPPDAVVRTGMASIHANLDANGYRLPTEAEWEYAARAGVPTAFYTGPIIDATDARVPDPNANEAGWHAGNSERTTHAGGQKLANGWGLWDMLGNVFEWTWDWYGPYPTDNQPVVDPTGPGAGTQRVLRGGSMMNPPRHLRAAHRHAVAPATAFYNIGFRVVQTVER